MILHIDLDAFFAMIEVQRCPELKGKAVIVGGLGKRGVVATASYEARIHGVKAAVAMFLARQRCPDGVFLSGDHKYYGEVSKRIMKIFYNYTPHIEPLSLDEAFLDVSGTIHLLGSPYEIAQKIRKEVFSKEGLWCSVGISTQKHIAKILSKQAKPQIQNGKIHSGKGILEVKSGKEAEFLQGLNIQEISGIGRKTCALFEKHGVHKVGEIADMDMSDLEKIVGKTTAPKLKDLAEGKSNSKVKTSRETQSMSVEKTFADDIFYEKDLQHHIVGLSEKLMGRLRKSGFKAKRINLKLRYSKGFKTITRDMTLPFCIDSGVFLAYKIQELLEQEELEGGVRLIGVGVSHFVGANDRFQEELDLFQSSNEERNFLDQWQKIEKTIDQIRYKFEDDSIKLASDLEA